MGSTDIEKSPVMVFRKAYVRAAGVYNSRDGMCKLGRALRDIMPRSSADIGLLLASCGPLCRESQSVTGL